MFNVSPNNGAISVTSNDPGAILANRTAGAGSITMAAGTTLNAGGEQNVYAGGTAIGATLNSGSDQFDWGTASGTTIYNSGDQFVESSGIANGTQNKSNYNGQTIGINAKPNHSNAYSRWFTGSGGRGWGSAALRGWEAPAWPSARH